MFYLHFSFPLELAVDSRLLLHALSLLCTYVLHALTLRTFTI